MIFIPPLAMTAERYTPTGDITAPFWQPQHTYPKGWVVRVGMEAYESLIADNIGNDPTVMALQWLHLGTDNGYAMFDESPATQTVSKPGLGLNFSIFPGVRTTAVSLLNIRASSARISVIDRSVPNGISIFDKTYTLVASGGTYWSWFFEPMVAQRALTVFSMPPAYDCEVNIQLAPLGGQAALGMCVIGRQHWLGAAEWGFQTVTEMRSKEYLDRYGNPVRKDLTSRRSIAGTLAVPTGDYTRVVNLLEDHVGKFGVFALDPALQDYRAATTGGSFERIAATLQNAHEFKLSLDVAGRF